MSALGRRSCWACRPIYVFDLSPTFGDAPSDVVADWIITSATTGVITGNPSGTPHLLVY